MLSIALNKTPNQKLSVDISGVGYGIETKLFDGMLYMTVYADDVLLCASVRAVPNTVVIPYQYLTKGGNFFWYCPDDEYPDWEKFNTQHVLLWLTDEELAAYVV